MSYALALIAAIGLSHIIVDSKLLEGFRKSMEGYKLLDYLVNCYQCTGFWSGIAIAWIANMMWNEVVLIGFAASVGSMVVKGILIWLMKE